MDQISGLIVEFPLRSASKVYRMLKYKKWWRNPNAQSDKLKELAQDVVIMESSHAKLAFILPTRQEAVCFSMCFSLLVKRAQQRPRNKSEGIHCGVGEVDCGEIH